MYTKKGKIARILIDFCGKISYNLRFQSSSGNHGGFMPEKAPATDLEILEELRKARDRITDQVGKVIVGQHQVIHELMISLLSRGHCLLIGVPGLAKTLLISTLARVLDLKFNRIQFTPDLMPSDITGTEIIEEDRTTGKRVFKFVQGPVFANIILADEINRTPPKTQAALLQAMQEHEVSAAGQTYHLEEPFFVLATQNPIEQEGTYPLPEAQLDRFMFNLWVDYPSESEEHEIVRTTTSMYSGALEVVLKAQEIIRLQDLVRRIPVADNVIQFAVSLVRKTRPVDASAADFIKEWISWGAGPRASQYLILGAKTRAALDGRPTPDIEDVKAVAKPVLRHRLVTSFAAEAEGVTAVDIVEKLLS
jgi:MoxR-like ATPase